MRFVVSPETDHDSTAATEPSAKLRKKSNAMIKIVYVLSRRDDIAPKAFYE